MKRIILSMLAMLTLSNADMVGEKALVKQIHKPYHTIIYGDGTKIDTDCVYTVGSLLAYQVPTGNVVDYAAYDFKIVDHSHKQVCRENPMKSSYAVAKYLEDTDNTLYLVSNKVVTPLEANVDPKKRVISKDMKRLIRQTYINDALHKSKVQMVNYIKNLHPAVSRVLVKEEFDKMDSKLRFIIEQQASVNNFISRLSNLDME